MGLTASSIPASEPSSVTTLIAAGFVSRFIAMSIDIGVIVSMIVLEGLLTAGVGLVLPKWTWLSTALPVAAGAAASIVPLAYFFGAVAIAGRTAGKAVMGIRVVGTNGRQLSPARSLLRALAYIVSVLPLFAGFAWVLVDRDRRGWHDYIARTRVVYQNHMV